MLSGPDVVARVSWVSRWPLAPFPLFPGAGRRPHECCGGAGAVVREEAAGGGKLKRRGGGAGGWRGRKGRVRGDRRREPGREAVWGKGRCRMLRRHAWKALAFGRSPAGLVTTCEPDACSAPAAGQGRRGSCHTWCSLVGPPLIPTHVMAANHQLAACLPPPPSCPPDRGRQVPSAGRRAGRRALPPRGGGAAAEGGARAEH